MKYTDWFKILHRWIVLSIPTQDLKRKVQIVNLFPLELSETKYRVTLKDEDGDYLTLEFTKHDELHEIRECKANPNIAFNLLKFKEPVEYTFRLLTK